MFTRYSRYFTLILISWLLLPSWPVAGQSGQNNGGDPAQTAITLFNAGEYRQALIRFRALEVSGQRSAMRDYYMGRCLVALGEELDEAIERLHGVLSRQEVPSDATFYLGRAHQLNYNFIEAMKYFERFEAEVSRQTEKEYGVARYKASCRSALEITSTYNPYEVMNVTFIDLTDSAQFTQIKMKGGQLRYKPDPYLMEGEERDGLTGLMFLPVSSVRGEYAFFSGYGRNRKEGAQLFRIRKGTGRTWGDPEAIAALNTEGDEVMPYFDPIDNDLYYATNGIPGMGGFDLFRSHYDSERDEWSEPMNLGFPINSTRDELLLLPGSDLGMLMFFSNRQGGDSLVTVYRVHLIEPRVGVDNRDFMKLREIASMGGLADEILAGLRDLAQTPYPEPENQKPESSRLEPPPARPAITPVKILKDGEESGRDQLASCFRHQEKADSLKRLAVEATIRVRGSEDPNDRWVWQKQIMLWEKKSLDEEALADQCFARIETLEASQRERMGSLPSTIEPDTVIDGMTVFRYTTAAPLEGEPGDMPAQEKVPASEGVINRFEILDHSPYSASNPVPMDVRIPAGTFYRIQLGVFSTEVESTVFRGITPITGERLEKRGLVKYYAGKFSRYSDASAALARIQAGGFEDAFIVAWFNGAQVPTQKAKLLE
jgi:hypothetical protein